MATCTLKGIPVTFPYEPYSIQKEYMEKVIECLQNEMNGVLESPTGTGKTLSLLCSSLAWLTLKKAQLQAQARCGYLEAGEFAQSLTEDLNKKTGGAVNVKAFFGLPRIIYSSRTHSQLSQAMQELKKTAYGHMKACIIGSRDQLCIHPEVMSEKANKNLLCKLKVQSRSCLFHNRVEKKKVDPTVRNINIVDIEDLVKLGKEHKFCPYFMSHELEKEADIIFMPYNYILDPRIRTSLGLHLKNNIIILDEAHNIEKICEESASLQIKSTDIALAIEEVTEVMKALSDTNINFADVDVPKDFEAEELCILKDMIMKFEKALDEVELSSEGSTFEGTYIFQILGKAGINDQSFGAVRALCEKIRGFLSTTGDSPFKKRGDGLELLADLLAIAFLNPSPTFKNKAKDCFKVHITIEDKKKNRDNWLTKMASSKQQCRVLNYWCFSPGFGMNMMMDQGVRSVILTSGTLAPLPPLISELGINVNIRLENPHVISPNQICVKILCSGPDGEALNCSYQNRNNPKYISSLGRSILNLIRLIPHGVLIFFPSYPILQKCQEHWQQSGLWSNIYSLKPIFVEPRDKEAFNSAMNEYYSKIQDPVYKGAIFMGVCRGKVSEGLDFADINGRAVLIVGLPYPPMMDPKIILKKRYLDVCNSSNKEYLRGDDWYALEAVRAVNQAIGRVIRHQYDYGAIILLDSRFNSYRIKSQLSLWLRDKIELVNNFGTIIRDIKRFFQSAENIQAPSMIKPKVTSPPKQLGSLSLSCNSSNENTIGSSSGLVTIHKRSPTGELENKPKKKRIVLVERKPEPQATAANRDSEYMLMVRDALTTDEYKIFLLALSEYRVSGSFEQLTNQLDKIFLNKYSIRYLLSGLACYIKAKHKSLFDEYYTKMN